MPIKQRLMCKHEWTGPTLTLKPDVGEAFIVEEICVDNTTPTEFTRVLVDRVMLAYLSTYNMYVNQFWIGRDRGILTQLMRLLFDKGIFTGFPIAEGQEMTVDFTGSGSPYARVFYQVWDAADIKPQMENGTKALEYLHFNYGTNTDEATAATTATIDKCLSPIEFPDFPFGAIVPPKTEIDIIGFMVSPYRKAAYMGDCLRWLRFIKDREVLFDSDRLGFSMHWPTIPVAGYCRNLLPSGPAMN